MEKGWEERQGRGVIEEDVKMLQNLLAMFHHFLISFLIFSPTAASVRSIALIVTAKTTTSAI